MGIGISYTNANGITSAFSAQGAGDAMSKLNGIIRQSESALETYRAKKASARGRWDPSVNKTRERREAERAARDKEQHDKNVAKFSGMSYKEWKARQAKDNGGGKNNPFGKKPGAMQAVRDFIKKIVTFNGALEEKFNKLALRGESTARRGGIFGKNMRGVFGFFSLDDFDEPKVGRTVSNANDTDEDPQGGDKKADENTPWCEDYVTRVFVSGGSQGSSEVAPTCLKFGYRTRKISAGGREFAVGEERVLDVAPIVVGAGSVFSGCFEIKGGNGTFGFDNPYYSVGGKTYAFTPSSITITTGFIVLRIDITSSIPTASLTTYGTFVEMTDAQESEDYYIIPLYKIESGAVTCDFRKGANAAMWEF